jgi:hypothetical protein
MTEAGQFTNLLGSFNQAAYIWSTYTALEPDRKESDLEEKL